MAITETDTGRTGTALAGPAALARGFLGGVAFGAAIAGFVVGFVISNGLAVLGGLGLFFLTVVVLAVLRRIRRSSAARPAVRTALAMIESRRALSSESGDIPVEFVLTVAPDGEAAYRVKTSRTINLVDLADYPVRAIVVVEYRPDEAWKAKIVANPGPEWASRAAEAVIDSAPESALRTAPGPGASVCLLVVLGLLIGAAAVVWHFRTDLFDDDAASGAKSPSSTAVSSTVSSSDFSASTTLSGPGRSMLNDGQMRRSATSLIAHTGTPYATEFGIDEHRMAARGFSTQGTSPAAVFDLRALPYERLPALVHQARTGLGIHNPTSWHIAFGHNGTTRTVVIYVTVTDGYGSASLEADAAGWVVSLNPS